MEDQFPSAGQTQVEAFGRNHRTGLVTLVFTDLIDSVALRRRLGDQAGTTLLQAHRQLVRDLLQHTTDAEEIETAGDSFLLVFVRPSDAVKFALFMQRQVSALAKEQGVALADRVGIHVGEVVIEEHTEGLKRKDLYGSQIDLCARVMNLAEGGQILLTRAVFDSARQVLKGEELTKLSELRWLDHGPYVLKGIDEPVDICEVGEVGVAALKAPAGSEKAQRQIPEGEEPVLGWRPAAGQTVPKTRWELERKLGEGGFGEVWLGRNTGTRQAHVFKFCFQPERVRFLKREMTLFRLLKERVGDHPHLVRRHDIFLEHPPYYVEMDYVDGADLRTWGAKNGGVDKLPLAARLEIVAQAADGLHAAHEAGIIHRDIKPANILIGEFGVREEIKTDYAYSGLSGTGGGPKAAPTTGSRSMLVKLTDFGIGQVVSEEYLQGITRAGFTQTLLEQSSSSYSGTHLYMAPELFAGKPASIQSDIYSLGVVLFQVVVGDLSQPLTSDWQNHIADPLLRDDIHRCIAGQPRDRFTTASHLAASLRSLPERQAARAKQQSEQAARERAAYRRGMFRAMSVATLIVAGMMVLSIMAVRQRNRARDEELLNRRLRYAAEVNLASHAWRDANLMRARELLEAQRPVPGEVDLRGFEWRFLWPLCRGDDVMTLEVRPAGRRASRYHLTADFWRPPTLVMG